MNKEKLWEIERLFYSRYPQGFQDPLILEIVKKHKPDKVQQMARTYFSEDQFSFPAVVAQNWVKLVSSSTMISLFDKPKFRDYIRGLHEDSVSNLIGHMQAFFYGDEDQGFTGMVAQLHRDKMAKWSILTLGPVLLRPDRDVFVKPTTAKGIIELLDVKNIKYQTYPTYEFYRGFRELIMEIKTTMHKPVSDNNAAITGFLMMAMEGL